VGTGFHWSLSRHDTFATCHRRYFYSYYAAPEDPEIHRLKKLSALPLWAGNVVHETIESVLRTHEAIPGETEQEALIRAAVHGRMLTEWNESRAGSLRFRLFEHEYEVPVEAEDKKILVGTVMRSLRNFFRSDLLKEAFAAGKERWLALEDLVSFQVGEIEVLLRMDLAFRGPDGRVVIVDWKTGRGEGRFNEVQLAAYALYAAEQGWVGDPQQLWTELAYLLLPRYVRRAVDTRKLDHARAFIKKSAGNMKGLLLDPLANVAALEAFAMVDRPRVCRRCNFRRLCFPRPAAAVAAPIAATV
jgi:CRISPR/Cas system-associated exonuclease Cas4 (RecB family)